jgi:hypothetical protein
VVFSKVDFLSKTTLPFKNSRAMGHRGYQSSSIIVVIIIIIRSKSMRANIEMLKTRGTFEQQMNLLSMLELSL